MRPLQRKLRTTFAALAVLGLLVVGVTSYTVVSWRDSEVEQERHYTRSLRLQEVRALTFEAFKEVPDAVIGGDQDARQDYERRLAPIDAAFEEWAGLAEAEDEQAEVEQVRRAADELERQAEAIFALVADDRRDEAAAQLESVEETAFEPFDEVTTRAVLTDRAKREVVRADAAQARRTANITLAVAALGVISLLLLVAAYLAGGLFGPLRTLHDAVRRLARGDTDVRLAEDGDDEIAQINRELNALAERLGDQARRPDDPGEAAEPGDAHLVLKRMVDGLREDAAAIQDGSAGAVTALLNRIDTTRIALDRIGGLAYPVDLDLVPLESMALLHEVVNRFDDEIVRHTVNTAIDVDPAVAIVVADRARLRETLSELARNALDALPERGGSLQLRVRPEGDDWVALEVEDDGSGFSEEDVAWLYDGGDRPQDARGVGLRLATSIVEQHGGRVQLERLAAGTIARVLLPRADHERSRSEGPRP